MRWLDHYLFKRHLRKQIKHSRAYIRLLSSLNGATIDDEKLAQDILNELKLIRTLEYQLSVMK